MLCNMKSDLLVLNIKAFNSNVRAGTAGRPVYHSASLGTKSCFWNTLSVWSDMVLLK